MASPVTTMASPRLYSHSGLASRNTHSPPPPLLCSPGLVVQKDGRTVTLMTALSERQAPRPEHAKMLQVRVTVQAPMMLSTMLSMLSSPGCHGGTLTQPACASQIEKPLSEFGDTVKYFEVKIVHITPRGGGITVGLLQGHKENGLCTPGASWRLRPGMVLVARLPCPDST
jgi:hypothetical protein